MMGIDPRRGYPDPWAVSVTTRWNNLSSIGGKISGGHFDVSFGDPNRIQKIGGKISRGNIVSSLDFSDMHRAIWGGNRRIHELGGRISSGNIIPSLNCSELRRRIWGF